jgi:transcriptional regulator with XRE-family HTH domain
MATSALSRGRDLREARERLGLSRAQLAGLAGCGLASLGAIEQGAVPERSEVLERAWAALEAASPTGIKRPDPSVQAGRVKITAAGRDHVPG